METHPRSEAVPNEGSTRVPLSAPLSQLGGYRDKPPKRHFWQPALVRLDLEPGELAPDLGPLGLENLHF